MEYHPKYAQPFTLEEAVRLDVSTIVEEIARLQLSLEHLRRTQAELQEYLRDSGPDHDITQAVEENTVVIGSQEERISILMTALSQKGVYTGPGSHYDLQHVSTSAPIHANTAPQGRESEDPSVTDAGGVYL